MVMPKSILAVDDEFDIVTIIKLALQRTGFKISTFTDPVLALEEFQQHSREYSMVLTDIRMPRMNGFELARKVNAINPKVKIFLMSAFEISKSELEKVLPLVKIEGFIQKPMSMKALVSLMEKHV